MKRIMPWALVLGAGACRASAPATDEAPTTVADAQAAVCPTSPVRGQPIPDVDASHRRVQTWVDKLEPSAADAILVDAEGIERLNATFSQIEGAFRAPTGERVADPELIEPELRDRAEYMKVQVEGGEYVEGRPGAVAEAVALMEAATAIDELRGIVDEAPLYCIPTDQGLYRVPVDHDFDRNRCASLHPGELVRVLRRHDAQWHYVDAGHTVGWLHRPTWTPPVDEPLRERLLSSPRLVPTRDGAGPGLRMGTTVPLLASTPTAFQALLPHEDGWRESEVAVEGGLHAGQLALSRKAVWSLALSQLDAPYGWGGRQGARDCSRFVRDVFVPFGLELARHSGVQAKLGSRSIAVDHLGEADKIAALEQAAAQGVVLLYMPGHIMLYLGRDGDHQYAVSSMSEYLEPCPGGPDTVQRVDRVAVTTLELGRGTERTAFIQRLTRLVVFGPTSPEPAGDAAQDPAPAQDPDAAQDPVRGDSSSATPSSG